LIGEQMMVKAANLLATASIGMPTTHSNPSIQHPVCHSMLKHNKYIKSTLLTGWPLAFDVPVLQISYLLCSTC